MKCPICGHDMGPGAAEIGRRGGSQTSAAKRAAAIRNNLERWRRVKEARKLALHLAHSGGKTDDQ